MLSRAYKLRFRRRLRLQKKQVEQFSTQAERHLEVNLFKRLERLVHVRRFVLSWLLLVLLVLGSLVAQIRSLSGYYQSIQPVPGGTYTEGILGSFTNANPLYATNEVDTSVSRLVFASLFKYDHNNQLVPDLAEGYTANDRGTVYTVKLKPGLVWHDGQPLTADDVVFTYQVIQSPDARSPLFNSWQNVAVASDGNLTITFTLSNSLASFPFSLTNGIIPKHLLGGVPMTGMRSISFNTTNPVGAGPFTWQAIQASGGSVETREEQIALRAFAQYHAGQPRLSGFVIRAFRSPQTLIEAYQNKEVDAMAGLSEAPGEIAGGSTRVHDFLLTAQVMLFMRTTQEPFTDVKVRQALVRSVDRIAILRELGYPTTVIREPLLRGQLGYNPEFVQASFDPGTAANLFNESGWVLGSDGFRSKDGKRLTFAISTQAGGEYERVANRLREQLRAAGVEAEVILSQDGTIFQSALSSHSYDALLYGISVGQDPDVFVYWHSSQSNVLAPLRLNFSEYKSGAADAALEAGRTRADPALRAVKYQPFLRAWRDDAPAIGLYQPRFLYITRGKVYGINERTINSDTDRFANVHNWMIRTAYRTPESN